MGRFHWICNILPTKAYLDSLQSCRVCTFQVCVRLTEHTGGYCWGDTTGWTVYASAVDFTAASSDTTSGISIGTEANTGRLPPAQYDSWALEHTTLELRIPRRTPSTIERWQQPSVVLGDTYGVKEVEILTGADWADKLQHERVGNGNEFASRTGFRWVLSG